MNMCGRYRILFKCGIWLLVVFSPKVQEVLVGGMNLREWFRIEEKCGLRILEVWCPKDEEVYGRLAVGGSMDL